MSATEIVYNKSMLSAQRCSWSYSIIGNIRDFDIGDEVEVGLTPVNKLYIRGKVIGLDNTTRGLVLNVTEIISIPGFPVKKFARRAVRISPKASLREASRILVTNGVQGALVDADLPVLSA